MLLSETAIDRVIASCGYAFFIGLALLAQVFLLPAGWGFGVLPGFMLFGLGIYGFAFRKWRTEPGLWMLALFLFIVLGFIYAYFAVIDINARFMQPAARAQLPPGWSDLRMVGEAGIGLALFQYQVRFFLSVLIQNWQRTRR